MRNHRNDGTDFSFFCHRRTSKDGNIGIAGKVTRTTDAVHHLSAADVSRVYIAINVCFDSSIDRDNTEAAYNFRVIWDFGWTHYQFVTEEVDVIINSLQTFVCDSQWTSTSKFHTSLTNQIHYCILQYFGIHFKSRDCLVSSQSAQYGIGDVSYPTLQWQEACRNNASFHISSQEVGNVLSDLVGDRIRCGEWTGLVRCVHFHYSDDFLRIYLYVR